MWSRLPGYLLIGCLAAAPGHAADERPRQIACLSSGEALDAVSSHKVIEPDRAIVVARGAAPGKEIVRAALCRDGEDLVYLVLALGRDGRLLRVTVDAAAGKVKLVH
jgi:uncharacterized membrane protein YkoI